MNAKYVFDGEQVTAEEFMRRKRAKARRLGIGNGTPNTQSTKTWPQHSFAMGVTPQQIPEAVELCKKLGVPTEFDRKGRAIFTSRAHRKAHCEAFGYGDFDGGYGDPQFRRK